MSNVPAGAMPDVAYQLWHSQVQVEERRKVVAYVASALSKMSAKMGVGSDQVVTIATSFERNLMDKCSNKNEYITRAKDRVSHIMQQGNQAGNQPQQQQYVQNTAAAAQAMAAQAQAGALQVQQAGGVPGNAGQDFTMQNGFVPQPMSQAQKQQMALQQTADPYRMQQALLAKQQQAFQQKQRLAAQQQAQQTQQAQQAQQAQGLRASPNAVIIQKQASAGAGGQTLSNLNQPLHHAQQGQPQQQQQQQAQQLGQQQPGQGYPPNVPISRDQLLAFVRKAQAWNKAHGKGEIPKEQWTNWQRLQEILRWQQQEDQKAQIMQAQQAKQQAQQHAALAQLPQQAGLQPPQGATPRGQPISSPAMGQHIQPHGQPQNQQTNPAAAAAAAAAVAQQRNRNMAALMSVTIPPQFRAQLPGLPASVQKWQHVIDMMKAGKMTREQTAHVKKVWQEHAGMVEKQQAAMSALARQQQQAGQVQQGHVGQQQGVQGVQAGGMTMQQQQLLQQIAAQRQQQAQRVQAEQAAQRAAQQQAQQAQQHAQQQAQFQQPRPSAGPGSGGQVFDLTSSPAMPQSTPVMQNAVPMPEPKTTPKRKRAPPKPKKEDEAQAQAGQQTPGSQERSQKRQKPDLHLQTMPSATLPVAAPVQPVVQQQQPVSQAVQAQQVAPAPAVPGQPAGPQPGAPKSTSIDLQQVHKIIEGPNAESKAKMIRDLEEERAKVSRIDFSRNSFSLTEPEKKLMRTLMRDVPQFVQRINTIIIPLAYRLGEADSWSKMMKVSHALAQQHRGMAEDKYIARPEQLDSAKVSVGRLSKELAQKAVTGIAEGRFPWLGSVNQNAAAVPGQVQKPPQQAVHHQQVTGSALAAAAAAAQQQPVPATGISPVPGQSQGAFKHGLKPEDLKLPTAKRRKTPGSMSVSPAIGSATLPGQIPTSAPYVDKAQLEAEAAAQAAKIQAEDEEFKKRQEEAKKNSDAYLFKK
ncbi:hypothetical protein SAICODRAFT_73031 [Saitoella complicata NRRL Y-17804]|nr:uncharacterized protein SAICODRAFT_73031 [Saitoella complicata NRRL Y-17804]ODQ50815.1 hypothetical protein SAICODRAFT_73031 [Saitoella complicata NRRL Y-17804]